MDQFNTEWNRENASLCLSSYNQNPVNHKIILGFCKDVVGLFIHRYFEQIEFDGPWIHSETQYDMFPLKPNMKELILENSNEHNSSLTDIEDTIHFTVPRETFCDLLLPKFPKF